MHVFDPSGNPACSGIHIRKHPSESCTRTAPRQYISVGPNQALATTFWSPVILNDIGHCPSCRTREAHTRCPFYERERQNRCGHPPDSNDEPSLAPRIGADPGDSALPYVASWSSPKVLMAQTADPLSAVQEHVHPSYRPSLGEMQARLINRTAAGSASTLIHPYSHA